MTDNTICAYVGTHPHTTEINYEKLEYLERWFSSYAAPSKDLS